MSGHWPDWHGTSSSTMYPHTTLSNELAFVELAPSHDMSFSPTVLRCFSFLLHAPSWHWRLRWWGSSSGPSPKPYCRASSGPSGFILASCKRKCCRVLSLCSFALLTLPPLPSSNTTKCRRRQAESPQCSLIVAMRCNRRDDFYNRPLFGMLTNGGMQTYIIQHHNNIILL